MLNQLFMQVVDMSKMASVVIVMVIIARMLLRCFPKSLSYILWSVVLFRLLCPISFESMISIVPNMTPTAYHYSLENGEVSLQEAQIASVQIIQDTFSRNTNNDQIKENNIDTEEKLSKVAFSWQDMFVFWGKYVWMIGMCVLFIYNSISYMKMRRRTATAIPLKENNYVPDENVSPFVMGIISPKIYIPSDSLLSFSVRHRVTHGMLLGFGESDIKQRIKNLAATKVMKKKAIVVAGVGVAVLLICLIANPNVVTPNETDKEQENMLNLTMDIDEHYITKTGDPANLYYIDEKQVLWGCGRNNAGQLGQGTQDYEFHDEMVKITENVVHVDYSQRDFVIYLTSDHKLYGMGNAGSGALQQYAEFDWDKYISPNYEHYYVSEPILLLENVAYARCGNHAALLQDGTVWTWGYNFAGNCGVADESVVTEPTKVADDVIMVWTGSVEYNADVDDISDFKGEYPRYMENTIIKKSDGSYWICGANIGNEEKTIPFYFEITDYRMICTHEFYPYELEEIE